MGTYLARSGYPHVDGMPGIDAYRFLEELFTELIFLSREIRSREYLSMKYELEEFQKVLNAVTTKKVNFELINRIETAKKVVEKLRIFGKQGDESKLIDFISESMQDRKAQRDYLDQVKKGIEDLTAKQKSYEKELEEKSKKLELAVEAAEMGTIPGIVKAKATDHSVGLKFAKIEKARRNKKQLSRDKGPAFQMLPTATYPLSWLRSRRVICRLDSNVPDSVLGGMFFTFRYTKKSDWVVEIVHQERGVPRMLRKFVLKPAEVDKMRLAGKTSKIAYSDGFVIIDSFNLLQLLTRISASCQ